MRNGSAQWVRNETKSGDQASTVSTATLLMFRLLRQRMHQGFGLRPCPAISLQRILQAVDRPRRMRFHCTPNDVRNIQKTNSTLKKRLDGYFIGRVHGGGH